MTKTERKEFRTLLYQRYGAEYMADKDSVEALYDVPFKWVMLETKAGWHPTLTLTEWKKRFNQTQAICVELLGNTVALEAWNDMVSTLAVYNQPERLRTLLLTGMTPEIANTFLSTNWPEDVFYSCLRDYQNMTSTPLKAEDLNTFAKGVGKTQSRDMYMQMCGRAIREQIPAYARANAMRGDKIFVPKWKKLREETIKKIAERNYVHPALAYNLLYLNYMIGDYQPKGDRVLRLAFIDIAEYRTYAQIEKERRELLNIISNHVRGADKIKAANELVDIEAIITHCNRRAGYKEYQEDAIKMATAGMGIPAYLLTAPIPPVKSAIEAYYDKVFGPHAIPAIKNSSIDRLYKSIVIDNSIPNGYIVMGSANASGKLSSISHKYMIYDSVEDDIEELRKLRQEKILERTFTNTALGEPYTDDLIKKCDVIVDVKRGPFNTASFDFKHKSYEKMLNELGYNYLEPTIPFADWKKLAELSRTAALATLDEIKERYGLNQRPTIALALALKDRISQPINKIKSEMKNMTNAAGPMTKEQKRIRIKELEDGLVNLKKHKAKIAEVEAKHKQYPALILRTELSLMNTSNHAIDGFTMFGQDFMKPEIMLKIYKVELDEEETRMTTELNALIA